MEKSVKIIPLGGFDKIGMNMTLLEYQDSMIIIDCGTSFPPNNMPGIDTSIPDISYIMQNKDKLKGLIVTHGHEDHIGAIPYVISDLNVPIYGTPLTILLVENKLKALNIKKARTKVIKQGASIVLGDFKIEFIKTNHSIPDAVSLSINTPVGTIIHTGDFKMDLTPINGDAINLKRLAAIGSKGVLAVMADSTNAMIEGYSPSETAVSNSIDHIFNAYKNNRMIIATFASNMDRVQQIIEIANKYGKKVILQGKAMLDIFNAAEKLGYIVLPKDTIINIEDAPNYPDNLLVYITTGNHGEPITCLAQIADGTHEHIKIKKDDTILFSSIPVMGSEKNFEQTMNKLEEQGANIIFQEIHATGHACSEELKLIYTLLNPKFVIPAHGQYRFRKASAKIAESIGVPHENTYLIKNGDVLEISENSCKVTDHIKVDEILIDGLGIGDIGGLILKERKILSDSGIVITQLCFDHKSGRLAAKPSIVTKGFINNENDFGLIDELQDLVRTEISRSISQGVRDDRLSKNIKSSIEDYIWKKIMRKPLIVVTITEIVL
ncbi:MAG: ribonuclease J [Butyrivibrio sp.]|uniref:ribonuclease J n=1 Tax=Butyrivibrio sp. TaxID=28121 RepID=UPI001ECC8748|nr:ribonuclease J [Butyrivibrio sp.]MBE5842428.1 ribonuclease J [Butyrivibrio sp.]